MNWKTLLLGFVLFDFAVLSIYAMSQVGYLGIWQAGLASWGAVQLLVDLVILAGLAVLWMIGDARARGLNPWPYVLITFAAGSFGPLLYLLRREWRAGRLLAQPA
ncbi:MAG: DUF2834 domain-containing protein [Gammaproteobacteria bacterium]